MTTEINDRSEKKDINTEDLVRLRNAVRQADAVMIGAGAGLSTAAGFVYAGEWFNS